MDNLSHQNIESCMKKELLMNKKTNKKIDRKLAVENLRKEAHRRVLKNEVMKFRLESDSLERLLKLAKRLNKPVGALVREWVNEKLDQAESGNVESPAMTAISIIATSLAEHGLLHNDEIGRINRLVAKPE